MDLTMSFKNITLNKPERWITEINGGVVTIIQKIEKDSFVVSIEDISDMCANKDFVSDEQSRLILNAIKSR
jgi:hypothetical protein